MVLDRKADLELINRLQDSKATKSEVKYQNALLEALNTRIKHLSILLAELASSQVPGKTSSSVKNEETLNSKLQRRDFLSR